MGDGEDTGTEELTDREVDEIASEVVDDIVDTVASHAEPSMWTPWRVAPESGFVVAGDGGSVGIVQIDPKRFVVLNEFRFGNPDVEAYMVRKLVASTPNLTEQRARAMVDEARSYHPREDNPTDLASIPRFMRWFENPYGRHSLAALIHDELIVDDANGGALGSDTLSDRFFREMMKASGVPYLKRWIMWAAVAIRSRFAAGGLRRWSLVVWGLLALLGIVATVDALGAIAFDWPAPIGPGWLLLGAAVLPLVSSRLWGEQWGASIVFAIAGFWIIPAGLIAGLGYLVYLAFESGLRRFGYR